MNYIGEINAFERWLEHHSLELAPQLLMYKFYKLANRAGWPEWVSVDNLTLMVEMRTKREATVIAWRDKLIEFGLLQYKKGRKGVPSRYKITSLYICTTLNEAQTVAEVVTESETQAVTKAVTETAALYKQETKTETKELCAFFESVWAIYPVKKGKGQISDAKKRKLMAVGYEQIARCIERYKASKPDWQQFQNGSTFFNSGYLDYLDENYSAAGGDRPKNGDRDEQGRVFVDGDWTWV